MFEKYQAKDYLKSNFWLFWVVKSPYNYLFDKETLCFFSNKVYLLITF